MFAVKVKQQIGDLLAGGGVQITGRLVGKQNGRLTGKGAGNGHPLLLAARQLLRIMTDTRLEADALKQLGRMLTGITTAGQLQRQHHVFNRVEAVQQLKGLEHETYFHTAQGGALVFIQCGQRLSGQQHLATAGQIQPGEQAEQGGLARTRGADNGNTAAALNAQAYVREYLQWRFRGGDDFVKVAGNYDSV